eukprot:TRINITY_DN27975_c0_g1_i1.p1 TRINITY_DN27975_c0_g1~~TRINITY_DN27975_c0_g1_i1.p1  ORF type:complete len:550 (+),score=121.95 TRINITY_DN27975_c0_g1_i1:84-1733(+)
MADAAGSTNSAAYTAAKRKAPRSTSQALAASSDKEARKRSEKLSKVLALVRSHKAHRKAVEAKLAEAGGRPRTLRIPEKEDWARLANGEFLNDALLDYFLGHLVARLGAGRVHVFSSLFITRLEAGGWRGVSTWTKSLRRETSVGVFAKDFIFVPIHDPDIQHWWLAVVCRPGAAGSSSVGAPRKRDRSAPLVAFLDSLADGDGELTKIREMRVLELLRTYLRGEWAACLGMGSYDSGLVQGKRVTVPQQTNGADCGVYVLEFALRLLREHDLLERLSSEGQVDFPDPGEHPRRRWRALGVELVHQGKTNMGVARKASAKRGEAKEDCVQKPVEKTAVAEGSRSTTAVLGTPPRKATALGKSTASPGSSAKGASAKEKKKKRAALSAFGGSRAGTAKSRDRGAVSLALREALAGAGSERKQPSVMLWISDAVRAGLSESRLALLESMGGRLSKETGDTEGDDATHLVISGPVRRTLKLMCAVCRGLHVVNAKWLEACLEAKRWLDESKFMPEETSLKPSISLTEALARARRRRLLHGQAVHVPLPAGCC